MVERGGGDAAVRGDECDGSGSASGRVLELIRFGAKVREDVATLLGSSAEAAHAGEALKK